MKKTVLLVVAATSVVSASAGSPFKITDQVRLWGNAPEWASLSYEHHFVSDHSFYPHLSLQAQAGIAGGRFSIGYGRLYSPKPGIRCRGHAVEAAVLRTWGDPIYADGNQTYVGLSVEMFPMNSGNIVYEAGAFYRLSGEEGGSDMLYTIGIGVPLWSEPAGTFWLF